MSLVKHAQVELEMAGYLDKDSAYDGMLGPAVIELMEVFAKQGHSGMSASIVRSVFHTLADFKPLGPITGEDKEWNDISDHSPAPDGLMSYQNKRCSEIFKDGKDGKPYTIGAIVWQGQESWDSFTGRVEDIGCAHYIKLPFTPKTFRIDVIREPYDESNPKHKASNDVVEGNDGKYVYFIKDMSQLDEVFEYYDRMDR